MEFLAAAIWLGMTTGEAAKPAPEVIWALSAPPGGAETWWKMSLLERPLFERADPTGLLSSDMSDSPAYLRLLLALAQIPRWGPCAAARTTAFAAVFSLASEDPSSMHTLINLGFVTTAVDTALATGAPPRARGLAGGLMLLLIQAEQGLADAGGWTRVEDVLISLAGSGHPDLALQVIPGALLHPSYDPHTPLIHPSYAPPTPLIHPSYTPHTSLPHPSYTPPLPLHTPHTPLTHPSYIPHTSLPHPSYTSHTSLPHLSHTPPLPVTHPSHTPHTPLPTPSHCRGAAAWRGRCTVRARRLPRAWPPR